MTISIPSAMKHARKLLLSAFLLLTWMLPGLSAPGAESPPQLFITVEDTGVHIYHLELPPPGQGFNIYRRTAQSDDYIRLNETVVLGARRGSELLSFLGPKYQEIRRHLNQPDASSLFAFLHANASVNELFSMVYPEVARALGRVYVDTDAPLGERVAYRLVFVDEAGVETGVERYREVLLEPREIPVPYGLEAENRGRQIRLSWAYPGTSRQDPDMVIHFNVYRRDPASMQLQRLNDHIILRELSDQRPGYSFMARNTGVEEHYLVTAVRMTGTEGQPSDELVYFVKDNIPPPMIRQVSARYTDAKEVEVRWEPSTDPAVAGYHVYRSEQASEGFERITPEMLAANEFNYLDAGITTGREYFYALQSISHSGLKGPKSASAVVFVYDFTPPPAPVAMEAIYHAADDQVLLQWATEDGRIPEEVVAYRVLRREKDGDSPTYSLVGQGALRALELIDQGVADAGLMEGITYQYALYAIDQYQNHSDTVYATVEIPRVTPPGPPNQLVAVNYNAHRIHLYWHAPLGLAVDNYRVYRKKAGDADFVHMATLPASQRMMRDEDVLVGHTYVYMVRSVDDVGNMSEESTPDSIHFRDTTPPRQVRGLQAAYIGTEVLIRWNDQDDPHLAGYMVFRSGLPTGHFQAAHPGVLEHAEFRDAEGTPNTWYQVRAIDKSGNMGRASRAVQPQIPE